MPRSPSSRPMRSSSPIRTRWPGSSTSEARTSRTRRCRCALRSCRARGGRRFMSTAASSRMTFATAWKSSPTCASPRDFERDLAALGSDKKTVRLDQATAADALARLITRHGGTVTKGADPIALMKAVKNPVEIAGARAAQARDGAAVDALPRLVRPRSAARQTDRDRGRQGAGKLPPRHRPAQGRVVSDHLRRRPRWRHRALSRHRQDRPDDPARRTLPHRFRRAVRGRHHRHHAHASRSGSRAPKCATASPACSRATLRSRARCFPTAPAARNSIRLPASSCGRPVSTSTTAPATASAATCRCTKALHASPSSARRRSSAA